MPFTLAPPRPFPSRTIIALSLFVSYFNHQLPSFRWDFVSRLYPRWATGRRYMPLCPTCDNRPFATKEALLQHVRTSSNPHPFCLACDRRFSSELAYNAHMAAKHPPTFDCLKCRKQYSSQFALDGHYRGHTDHPNCPVCGKGFYDNGALTAHARETHTDLWCNICNLRFETTTAANEHYTTSPAHPKCRICGVSFRDEDMLEKHSHVHEPTLVNGSTTSPSVSASGESGTPTVRSPIYASSANLLQSPPTSAVSSTVFSPPSSASTQVKELPPVQPGTVSGPFTSPSQKFASVNAQPVPRNGSAISFGGTGFSPISPKPNIFSKDLRRVAAIDTTTRTDSPDISQMLHLQASPLLNVQAPIFSPIGLPRPGKQVDELWSSRENVQVPRTHLPRQPGLQAPISLPISPPSWNARPGSTTAPSTNHSQQLIPFSQPYRFQGVPPRYRPSSEFGDGRTPTTASLPPVGGVKRGSPTFSESRLNSSRAEYNFNPRLYPGSARFVASQVLPNGSNGQNIQASIAARRGSINALPTPPANSSAFNSFNPSYEPAFRQHPPSLLSLPLPFSSLERQDSAIRISPPRSIATPETKREERDQEHLRFESVVKEDSPQAHKASLQDDLSLLSAVSTPRFVADAPLQEFGVKPGVDTYRTSDTSLPSPSDFSTDFSTISSVSSNVLPAPSPTPVYKRKREPSRSRSRATSSTRSEISSFNIPTYKVTESSQCASPTSPEVVSPIGLAVLPAISPLGPSPVDLDRNFDIPEAQHPLPESLPPSPSSAHDLFIEENAPITRVKSEKEAHDRSLTVLGIHQENSALLSPLNGSADHDSEEKFYPELSPPSSPQSFVTSNQELHEEFEGPEIASAIVDPISTSRVPSRSASVYGVSHETPKSDSSHEVETEVTAKSPSPTPSPVLATPKAEDDVTLPQVVSSSHLDHEGGEFSKQHLVAPSLGVTPNVSIASTSASDGMGGMGGSSSSLPSLQCRACRRETPDDITATVCGHVFCNRCIVDAVIKTSRCPFCSTPTLLYCLFRLDLAT